MKKVISIGALLLVAFIIYILFVRPSYRGTFDIFIDGKDYKWGLKSVNP